jgi:hypothetical protein
MLDDLRIAGLKQASHTMGRQRHQAPRIIGAEIGLFDVVEPVEIKPEIWTNLFRKPDALWV